MRHPLILKRKKMATGSHFVLSQFTKETLRKATAILTSSAHSLYLHLLYMLQMNALERPMTVSSGKPYNKIDMYRSAIDYSMLKAKNSQTYQ